MSKDETKSPSFRRVKDPKERARLRAADERGDWDIKLHEAWWKDRYHILEEHGYEVRPRFRPGWKPSWRGTDFNPILMEDAILLKVRGYLFPFMH